MTRIITAADSESNAVKSQRYPVLEAGNLSFPRGRYVVEVTPQQRRSGCLLEHDVQQAKLITRLLDQGAATYCCAVSSPVSSYRWVHFSAEALQKIGWNPGDMGEPPLFTPMIVASESRSVQLCSERDEVHRFWTGRTVKIEKGSRLAVGRVVRLKPTLLHLLRFNRDPELDAGRFRVDAESQPFQFVVTVSADLHRFLQYDKGEASWGHIMTHIVTACFALLQRDFLTVGESDEDGWQVDRNLEALADFLEQKGLPHWEEAESFRPEEVATELYPHLLGNGTQER